MRLPALLLVAAILSFSSGPAEAKLDPTTLGVCVGYDMCEDIDGFALFCVKYKGHWVCGQCEACGNEPWTRELA